MSLENELFPQKLLDRIGSSGFPFQTAVAAAIRASSLCRVEEEVAWTDEEGSHRFLDIVAKTGNARICIECKAMREEKLVFLLPNEIRPLHTMDIHGVFLRRQADSGPVVRYGTIQSAPFTPESMYCVAASVGSGNRLLESEIQPLVRGSEYYARDQLKESWPREQQPEFIVPLFLTTAALFEMRYDPSEVSLDDAIHKVRVEQMKRVSVVRFAKQFTSRGPERTRLRTAIVANAAGIGPLLLSLASMKVEPKEDGLPSLYASR